MKSSRVALLVRWKSSYRYGVLTVRMPGMVYKTLTKLSIILVGVYPVLGY